MHPISLSPMLDWLFPQVRAAILGRMMLNGRARYARELARELGVNHASVRRELNGLAEAGILTRERSGNRVHYSLNPACPIYPELKMLLIKTVGLADVLREALQPLAGRIKMAFIYGSFARGEERVDSDVDVMVIGDASFGEVVHAIYDTQKTLRRDVNPSVYPVAEYLEKLAAGHHFVTEVLKGEKIFLIGDDHDLAELVR
jgi:predicted nucleotidyltransferase